MGAGVKIIGRPKIAAALGVSVSTLKNWRHRYGTDKYIYRLGGRWASTERELNQLWDTIKEAQ